MRIGQADSGNGPSEPLPSPERQLTQKRDIGFRFFDEPGTEHHVQRRIGLEGMDEFGEVIDRVLAVRVERYDVGNSDSFGVASQKFEPGLERSSASSVIGMLQVDDVIVASGNGFGIVFGSVVHHADFPVSRRHYRVDDRSNTSRFVVRPDQETNIVRTYFFGFHTGDSKEFKWDILDSRKEISRTSRVMSSRFFSLLASRSRVKYKRKIMLVYTNMSAPLGTQKIAPIKLRTLGIKEKTSNQAPTARNTIKWKALNFCRREISNANMNIMVPDMKKNASNNVMRT